ncbi:MAG: ABC transporter ATP-binding protein [Acidimicrobiia bacterium]|nr:ABC transporter ATP-binding protein [Acidimicrobiia bacterium]
MAAIDVSGLAVSYGPVRAVADVSFAVAAGETVVLLGPNGAGKTTTVEALEGYRRPAAGQVRVLGLDPVADARALRPRIGVMPQAGGVHPGIRPLEALRLFASYYPAPLEPAALLERVGLTHRVRSSWRQLSGGEQQRLSLALALVGRPEVAFLDEPTAGIDLEGRQAVRSLVAGLRADGVSVLMTTHDLEEAERTADRIVIVDRGRVVADGTPAELLAAGPAATTFSFSAPVGLDRAKLGEALGAPVEVVEAGRYQVSTAPTPAAVAALTAWLAEHDLPLGDLAAGRRRLEDVFLRLTEGDR